MIRSILLCLLAVILLPINPVSAEGVGREFTIGIQSTKTISIRPFEAVDRDMLSIYNAVYESLVYLDDNYMPQGCLAESWEPGNNGKTWTFTLRSDIRFSDGTPITADDVVASAQYILDKANDENIVDHGFYSNLGYFVKSVSAKDEKTVIFKAKRPYYGILFQMTFPVVPASQVSMDNPIGSGPYVISHFQAGSDLMLEKNVNWWKTQPEVERIYFQFCDRIEEVIIILSIEVIKEHFPSLNNSYMHETSDCLLVKFAAIEASSADSDTLTWAVLNAEQSLAPSPHINVVNPSFFNPSTNKALCSGAIRAKTLPFFRTRRYAS